MNAIELDLDNPTDLTRALVRIDSVNPDLVPGAIGEAEIATFTNAWLTDRGFEVHTLEATPGRPTIVAVAKGTGGGDLYAPPENLGRLIDQVRASTVTILCKDSQGSGWVVSLDGVGDDASEEDRELDRKYPNEVITNHHVIEECVDEPTSVRARTGAEEYDAYLYSWDEENDLALVAITQDVPFLEVSKKPEPGWWAMAVGTPYGLEGSVSIGNVMNIEDFEVYSTSPLNSGNSGGPMVNSQGEVMGTSTATRIGEEDPQDWNIAVGSPALCVALILCDEDDPVFLWD